MSENTNGEEGVRIIYYKNKTKDLTPFSLSI